ncbi:MULTISPECIES: hypothetical protein [Leptotrichia]|uniref:hypothetical protein n=1 Tax=Leptotrichia TaxID=32067 RepID=UPI000767FA3E|nr:MULTISPECIES: hypothetical protein [Leptotrichia]AMD95207.1 hypothetical protein AXF11_06200 [Leptotrichia sp. oral taxon 847]
MRKKLLQFSISIFLLVFIKYVGFFLFGIFPLLFNLLTLKTEYDTNGKNLKLSKSYNIIDCDFGNYLVLHGPEYLYSFKKKDYLSYDYGVVTKLVKNGNDWIGFIRDEDKEKIKYYMVNFSKEDEGFYRASEKKVREVHGYFIINEKEAVFNLSEEELKNRKINKIEFKNPGYYVAKYGENTCKDILKTK